MKAWCSVKPPRKARASASLLPRRLPQASSASTAGLRSPRSSASIISRPDLPNRSVTTEDSSICAPSSIFSARCLCRVRSRMDTARVRVRSRSSRILSGGTNEARSMPRSVSLHSRTASSLSVFGRPGTFFTSLALTSRRCSPQLSSG